ncbi:hypothetical protein [Sphingomonas sp. CCH5-D11]|uniref:hypothetical protein n=1 Tax=Sphingomonas sp. CCH5-D11 TaxID=1768786 RepID=UPI0018D266BE|nr:hypothetical protein [Sphingomonas sp. CCH5-D11]
MAIERHDRPRAAANIELGSHVRQRVSAADDRALEQHQHDAEQRCDTGSKGGQDGAHDRKDGTIIQVEQARTYALTWWRKASIEAYSSRCIIDLAIKPNPQHRYVCARKALNSTLTSWLVLRQGVREYVGAKQKNAAVPYIVAAVVPP